MSDQKYVNYYIEHAVGQAHEYLNTILQLKTQLRMANDVVEEKINIIGPLQTEIESLRTQLEDSRNQNNNLSHSVNQSNDDKRNLEEQLHALQNKVSHMDTLLNQLNDMKRIIKEKDAELEALRTPVINTKKKPVKPEPTVLPNKPNEDF